MPVFKNRTKPVFQICPDGEQVLRVVKFERLIQGGSGKTAGSFKYEVTYRNDKLGLEFTDNLIDHESCAWKIDLFLLAFNAQVPLGAFEFIKPAADKAGVPWVDPIGLQGWAWVSHREYDRTTGPQKGTKGKAAQIETFLTEKPKLPRWVDPAAQLPASAPEEPAGELPPEGDDLPF